MVLTKANVMMKASERDGNQSKNEKIHEVNWLVPADMFTNVIRKFEHKKHAVRLLSRRQQHRRELRRELDSPSQIIIARAAQAQRHHT